MSEKEFNSQVVGESNKPTVEKEEIRQVPHEKVKNTAFNKDELRLERRNPEVSYSNVNSELGNWDSGNIVSGPILLSPKKSAEMNIGSKENGQDRFDKKKYATRPLDFPRFEGIDQKGWKFMAEYFLESNPHFPVIRHSNTRTHEKKPTTQGKYMGYWFIKPKDNWQVNLTHGPITITWAQFLSTGHLYCNDERQLTKRQPHMVEDEEVLAEYQRREAVDEDSRAKGVGDCDFHLLGLTMDVVEKLSCVIVMIRVRDLTGRQDIVFFSASRNGIWKGTRAHGLITVEKAEKMSLGSEDVLEEHCYRSHREIGMDSKGLELRNQMKKCGVRPYGFVCNVFIDGLCEVKKVDNGQKLFDVMLKRNVGLLLHSLDGKNKTLTGVLFAALQSGEVMEFWDLSTSSILLEEELKNKALDSDSKLQAFYKAVNISTVTKVWAAEYPLDFLYFGNMYCDLGFELVVFDVGWKDAEFIEDQISSLSLEDKVDFKRAVMLGI